MAWDFENLLVQPASSDNLYRYTKAWNGTVFCAVNGTNTCYLSTDSVTWNMQSLPIIASAIAWNGSFFCIVGPQGGCATSPDGITWVLRALPDTGDWSSIAWNGSVFCAIERGNASNTAATSPDGIMWTSQTLPTNADWASIVWNGAIFCVVGTRTTTLSTCNTSLTSPDGITWTSRTIPSKTWRDVAWNGTVFCAVGDRGACATSPDGITWTLSSFPTTPNLVILNYTNIDWNGVTFCVASSDASTVTATSTNGVVWKANLMYATSMTWDGYYLWVFYTSNFVTLITPINATLGNYHNPNNFFDEVTAIADIKPVRFDFGTTVIDSCFWNGIVYATKDDRTILAFNFASISNGIITPTTITTPASIQGVIEAANGKLWVVSFDTAVGNDEQMLYVYDIATATWSSHVIPGRKQQMYPRDIIDGLDGKVYITDANDHAIIAFDHVTNTYVDTYRINRHPYKLAVNQAKTIYVTSDLKDPTSYNEGMVSTFNQVTHAVTSLCSAGGTHEVLVDDERRGEVWMFGRKAGMMRVNKSTQDLKWLTSSGLAWTAVPSDILPNSHATIAQRFTNGWAEGIKYVPGEQVISPIDNNVYSCNVDGVSTPYDIPGVPDNASLTIWNSREPIISGDKATFVSKLRNNPVVRGTITPRFSYEVWNGSSFDTVTVPEHLVALHYNNAVGTATITIARLNALTRVNSYDALGTALISTGPQNWIGDF